MKEHVSKIYVYVTPQGVRWTARSNESKIVADSQQFYRSRKTAAEAALKKWPGAEITFEQG